MKKSLRQNALNYRKRLAPCEITAFGHKITDALITLLQTHRPCTVCLFYPTKGEPNVLDLVGNPMLEGFSWALPVCCNLSTGPVLQFAAYQNNDNLEPGQYNIPVPVIKSWVQPSIVLVPCLAFHRLGARLGYGAGWYDRTLTHLNHSILTVGIAYSETEILENFAEPHDQPLAYVITEREVINCLSSLHNQ